MLEHAGNPDIFQGENKAWVLFVRRELAGGSKERRTAFDKTIERIDS
jgi:hypothetical protein